MCLFIPPPHCTASRDDRMNQPDEPNKYISQKPRRLSLSKTPGDGEREPITRRERDSRSALAGGERCHHAGRNGGEASLPLYDANYPQTPTHSEQSPLL